MNKRRVIVRKPLSTNLDQSLVSAQTMFDNNEVILLITPRVEGIILADWLKQNANYVMNKVHHHGALLFRGFNLKDDDDFVQATNALPFKRIDASIFEESTPRKKIRNGVYTTTLFPSQETIFLHSDYSASMCLATKLCFFCLVPPAANGETPFADSRQILQAIEPDILRKFERLGWCLVRNYRPELGLAWQDTFFGKTREEIEQHCIEKQIELEWNNGVPRTTQVRSAILKHPVTGERTWYNHVAFWHIANLPSEVRETMLREVGPDGMPFNTYYGDGSEIPNEIARHIYDVQLAHKKKFKWQQGDFVLADNILTCHGREPFSGDRIIRVSLFEQLNRPLFIPG